MALLLDQIRELGEQIPDATAITFVNERGQVTGSMSRADVVSQVSQVADFLRKRCNLVPGDRALLVYPPGLDFVRGLVGCMAAGVLPVPIYPPDPVNPQRSIEGFQQVAVDCGAKAVLTSRRYSGARRLGTAKSLVTASSVDWPKDLPWYVTSRRNSGHRTSGFGSSPKAAWDWAVSRDTPALLQYTSGSTAAPKGVVITHGNLAHQIDFNRRALGLGLDTRGVFWLPPYHDFGLISVILSALAGNTELTILSPLSFIQRPALWFEVMHRMRATHTAAPNFAYELAVRKTTAEQRAQWDLSSLKVVMSAAEPVREDTTCHFLEAFAVAGLRPEAFCPAYGLAEHTVGVTVFGRSTVRVDRYQLETQRLAVPAEGPSSQVLMSCGELTGDIDVRIVDPELCVPLPDGRVGEIWVDSPSKAAGYWGAPDKTRAAFQARLSGVDDDRGYLRTGDMGFVRDGELYVCGRIKDLLILAGRNIHPQDIEDSLRGCHPATRPGGIAAFAIDAGTTEALAVLVEVPADASPEVLSSVVRAVRAVVLKDHQLRCSVVVLGPPGSVSKTTSGKVQRSRCRARLLDGSLETEALLMERFADDGQVGATATAPDEAARQVQQVDEPLAKVREHVAAVFAVHAADVDIDQPLAAQGLGSVGAVELALRLSQVFGTHVDAVDVFNHPSVRDLARMLGRSQEHRHQQPPREAGGPYAAIGAGGTGPAAELDGQHVRPRKVDTGPHDQIAIVGMACRYPGGLNSPGDLWRAVLEGRDLVSGLPTDRGWNVDNMLEPSLPINGKSAVRAGGFVSGVTDFDADFFEISSDDALVMDTHQRLALECAWEVLERAGIDPSTVRGADAGVFLGLIALMGGPLNAGIAGEALERLLPAVTIGQQASMTAGRISYFLGLEGPAITLDTACSSSLVAIHQAAASLRSGECSLALAGGVTVMQTPLHLLGLTGSITSAPDGRCKPFAAAADGTGWGEGAGILLLERLSDARDNQHPVLAVLRGSAVSHAGASNTPLVPNGLSQERVIRQALVNARLQPADVDVLEANGTGTPIGDLIEVKALIATYGHDRQKGRPLWVGSIKSNMGHTLAASGVAGVIKMIQAIRYGVIPPSLHADEPTPQVDWSSGGVRLPVHARPWQRNGARRAGVSAFGISGVNAHLIVEQAPEPLQVTDDTPELARERAVPVVSWVITAKSPQALPIQGARLAAQLEQTPDFRAVDVGFSLASSRAQFAHRAVIVGRDRDELLDGLRSLAAAEMSPAVVRGVAGAPTKTVALFAGEGAQWVGMGKQLYSSYPRYADAFDEVCAAFDAKLGTPLRDVVFAESGSPAAALLDGIAYGHPALFAVEVALYRLAQAWGLRPDFVVGHSLGEITAAYVAGLWRLEDACVLVSERTRLIQSFPTGGGVLAVAAPDEDVAALLDMDPILPELARVCEQLSYQVPEISVVSGVTGKVIDPGPLSSPEYWVDQLRKPVRFMEAMSWARSRRGVNNFLEIGPGAGLTAITQNVVPSDDNGSGTVAVASLLEPKVDQALSFVRGLATMYAHGTRIDWANVYAGSGARTVDLPTYAFQRKRLWLDRAESLNSGESRAHFEQ